MEKETQNPVPRFPAPVASNLENIKKHPFKFPAAPAYPKK